MPTTALAVDQHRIYRSAAIVDRRISDDLDEAVLGIDLDLADGTGISVGRGAGFRTSSNCSPRGGL